MCPFFHPKQEKTGTNRSKDLGNNGPGLQSVFQVMHFESILSQICSLALRKLVLVGAFGCNAGVSSFMFSCSI